MVNPGIGGLKKCSDMKLSPFDGQLYVASEESGEVLKYDTSTGNFLGVFASMAMGFHPNGLLFMDDILLVSSHSPPRIYRFSALTGYVVL